MASQTTNLHYTPHATLAAVGLKIISLKLLDTIGKDTVSWLGGVTGIAMIRYALSADRCLGTLAILTRFSIGG
jgi:hypothetical protein